MLHKNGAHGADKRKVRDISNKVKPNSFIFPEKYDYALKLRRQEKLELFWTKLVLGYVLIGILVVLAFAVTYRSAKVWKS